MSKIQEKRHIGNFGKRINEEKDKNVNSGLLPSKRPKKGEVAGTAYSRLDFVIFFRERAPSL